jgi:ABC-type amino acid transport substrate-binding protein
MLKMTVRFKKSIFFIGLVGLFMLFFSFPGFMHADSEQPLSKLEAIKKAGKLRIGTSSDYPPYEFHLLDDREGDIIGLDIDIAREIARELGVQLEIKDIVFHKLFEVLNADEVDLVIAGMAPSERRQKLVDFSDIYYQAIQNMIIRALDADKITYLRDLRGKRVGTQKGSIQEELVNKQVIGAEFVVRENVAELIGDLKNKKVDAVILEKPVAESFVMRNKDLVNIECHSGAYDALLGSAIAVKKGNPELVKEINRILQKLKDENKILEFVEDAKILMNK